jgi:biopolymer transport protein ExbB
LSLSRSRRKTLIRTAAGLLLTVGVLGGAAGGSGLDLEGVTNLAKAASRSALAWYERTPASGRMTWGGIVAASALGLGVSLERLARLRRKKIVPDEFTNRFLDRLKDGRLDRGKAVDFCELNPSPASRVALAAVKRWGRPLADLERAVGLAHRVEADRLRRNVGTLRRLAAIAPLLGLLGTLFAVGRTLSTLGPNDGANVWGPALASALGPFTAGIAMAVLALVAFDGLTLRAEGLVAALDLVGAETIDAVALALPLEPRTTSAHGPGPGRTPHQAQGHLRMEAPHASQRRSMADETEFE